MSTFSVPVVRIRAIEPIEDADAIELAVIGDYRAVVRKDVYRAGDLAVYIPEASIVPENVLRALGLEGRLAGKAKNRVKAIKLRGCLSQGLLYPVDSGRDVGGPFITVPTDDGVGALVPVSEGQDVAAHLDITKWEPPIPVALAGEVYFASNRLTVKYDFENIKWFPDVLTDGEEVVMTEKIHGTFVGIGVLPAPDRSDEHYRGRFVIFSKGLGEKGFAFKHNERNAANTYVRTAERLGILDKLDQYAAEHSIDVPLFIFGEVFGAVQDLKYGLSGDVDFRAFDIAVGYRGDQTYFNYDDFIQACNQMSIGTVPLLYRGPFSKEALHTHTSGPETVSGTQACIREGTVVKPTHERIYGINGSRVIFKSVSEAYLLRNGGTEYQ